LDFCPPSPCSIKGWDAIGISREGWENSSWKRMATPVSIDGVNPEEKHVRKLAWLQFFRLLGSTCIGGELQIIKTVLICWFHFMVDSGVGFAHACLWSCYVYTSMYIELHT
jgi:hypothetical protein